MDVSRRNLTGIVSLVTLLTFAGLLVKQNVEAEPPRIIDGSNVTFLYQITVPGEYEFDVRVLGHFVQGLHQLPPTLERMFSGMKRGDEKKIELTAEEGFGNYDAGKKKTIPRRDVPADTKKGDVFLNLVGQKAIVTHLSDESAVVDYNHPLAGKPVVLTIKVLQVDDPGISVLY